MTLPQNNKNNTHTHTGCPIPNGDTSGHGVVAFAPHVDLQDRFLQQVFAKHALARQQDVGTSKWVCLHAFKDGTFPGGLSGNQT